MPDVPVEAIAEALREATPGPWSNAGYDDSAGDEGWWILAGIGMDEHAVAVTAAKVMNHNDEADAHLIANAPTWLAQLLAALEAERVAHAETRRYDEEVLNLAHDRAIAAEAALEAKDGEVERLRGAILDIDAHASALGEDAEGFVRGGYVVSVGAMHRALGVVGHTAYTRAECAVWMELEHGSACAGCVQMQEIALSAVAAALAPSTPPDLREDA